MGVDRYRPGRYMNYADLDPDSLGEAVAREIHNGAEYSDVETDGASKTAKMITKLI